MDFTVVKLATKSSLILFQCLGWGTLALINILMMWLAGNLALEPILNLTVFFTLAVVFSFVLRNLLKPIAASMNLLKLVPLALAYSFISGAVTVQSGVILLGFLPPQFGGQAEFNVAIYTLITLAWTLIFAIWSLCYVFMQRQRALNFSQANESRLDELLTKARLATLQGQINPHFIFNAINNIRALVLEDKERARDMMASLSDMLRYSLDTHATSMVTVQEELENVGEYLAICKMQFERRMQVSIDYDQALNGVLIPRMIVQMLVENAVKHGIAECLEVGLLVIKLAKQNNQLTITVANSGQLKQTRNGERNGIGITNIKERLAILYDKKAKVELTQRADMVVATITLPIDVIRGKN